MLRRTIAPGAASLLAWLALWAVASLLPPAVASAQEEEDAEEAKEEFPFARRGFFVGLGGVLAVDMFEDEYRKSKYHSNDAADPDNILSTDKEGGSRLEDPRTRQRLPDSDCRAAGLLPPCGIKGTASEPGTTTRLLRLDSKERVGLILRAGYRFHERLSAEVMFEVTDAFEVAVEEDVPFASQDDVAATCVRSSTDPTALTCDVPFRKEITRTSVGRRLRPMTLTINTKAYLAKGKFQPFILLGPGAMFANVDNKRQDTTSQENAFALRFGGGFDYYITENIVINTGFTYVYPFGDLQDKLDYFSMEVIGFQYRF